MKQTVDDKLNTFLNIFPSSNSETVIDVVATEPEQPKEKSKEETNIDDDYEYARNNLKGLIENGKSAMENIIFLAKEGESPRAYEVVGQLIKTLADTNKDLLDLVKKAREAKGKDTTQQSQNIVTNNSLFVGSTAELQKLIKGK
jgi:hypothetical protein